MDYIPLDKCVHGKLYRIHCRNLSFGVFNSQDQGFIGIREKFGSRYLFTEYHWDTGAPCGTVHPHEELESVPDDIEIKESLGAVDEETRKPVVFDKPKSEGGKGWHFVETGEPCKMPISVSNKKLFQWLELKWDEYKDRLED